MQSVPVSSPLQLTPMPNTVIKEIPIPSVLDFVVSPGKYISGCFALAGSKFLGELFLLTFSVPGSSGGSSPRSGINIGN